MDSEFLGILYKSWWSFINLVENNDGLKFNGTK